MKAWSDEKARQTKNPKPYPPEFVSPMGMILLAHLNELEWKNLKHEEIKGCLRFQILKEVFLYESTTGKRGHDLRFSVEEDEFIRTFAAHLRIKKYYVIHKNAVSVVSEYLQFINGGINSDFVRETFIFKSEVSTKTFGFMSNFSTLFNSTRYLRMLYAMLRTDTPRTKELPGYIHSGVDLEDLNNNDKYRKFKFVIAGISQTIYVSHKRPHCIQELSVTDAESENRFYMQKHVWYEEDGTVHEPYCYVLIPKQNENTCEIVKDGSDTGGSSGYAIILKHTDNTDKNTPIVCNYALKIMNKNQRGDIFSEDDVIYKTITKACPKLDVNKDEVSTEFAYYQFAYKMLEEPTDQPGNDPKNAVLEHTCLLDQDSPAVRSVMTDMKLFFLDKHPQIAMKYGCEILMSTLPDISNKKDITYETVKQAFVALCAVSAKFLEKGLMYVDYKLANVIYNNNRVVLIDFGGLTPIGGTNARATAPFCCSLQRTSDYDFGFKDIMDHPKYGPTFKASQLYKKSKGFDRFDSRKKDNETIKYWRGYPIWTGFIGLTRLLNHFLCLAKRNQRKGYNNDDPTLWDTYAKLVVDVASVCNIAPLGKKSEGYAAYLMKISKSLSQGGGETGPLPPVREKRAMPGGGKGSGEASGAVCKKQTLICVCVLIVTPLLSFLCG
jgi:hypothetical protein